MDFTQYSDSVYRQNVMDNLGYELKIKDIYSETTPSLKDACGIHLKRILSGVTCFERWLFLPIMIAFILFLKRLQQLC